MRGTKLEATNWNAMYVSSSVGPGPGGGGAGHTVPGFRAQSLQATGQPPFVEGGEDTRKTWAGLHGRRGGDPHPTPHCIALPVVGTLLWNLDCE